MIERHASILVLLLAACRSEVPPPAAAGDTAASLPAAPQPDELFVQMADTGPVFQLPADMRAALEQYAPQFRPWRLEEYDTRVHEKARPPRNMPIFAHSSDMNGDGMVDLALLGHDGTNELLFVIMSNGSAYRVVEIRRGPLPPETERVPQAHYLEPPPAGRSGFIESIEGVAGVLYYWKDGRFHEEVVGE